MTEVIRAPGYDALWAPDVEYERAPLVRVDTDDFGLELAGRKLRAILKRGYATIDEARTQVDEYLRNWELVIGLEESPGAVRFKYRQAEVEEDEVDPQTGQHIPKAKACVEGSASMPAVEAMYPRYSRYKAKGEVLTSAAYSCLTVLEQSVSGTGSDEKPARSTASRWESLLVSAICAQQRVPRRKRGRPLASLRSGL